METWQERIQNVRSRVDVVSREVKYQNQQVLDVLWGDALDLINESLSVAHAAWVSSQVATQASAAQIKALESALTRRQKSTLAASDAESKMPSRVQDLARSAAAFRETLDKTRSIVGALAGTLATCATGE